MTVCIGWLLSAVQIVNTFNSFFVSYLDTSTSPRIIPNTFPSIQKSAMPLIAREQHTDGLFVTLSIIVFVSPGVFPRFTQNCITVRSSAGSVMSIFDKAIFSTCSLKHERKITATSKCLLILTEWCHTHQKKRYHNVSRNFLCLLRFYMCLTEMKTFT
jgi:hypothetical protein